MLQFNINDKKKEKNNVHGTIPTGNVLSYTLYIYTYILLYPHRDFTIRAVYLFIIIFFLLYAIKEITKKANNSIEFRTMQVDVRFFHENIRISFAARYQTCCRSRSTSRSGHKNNDILSIQNERHAEECLYRILYTIIVPKYTVN